MHVPATISHRDHARTGFYQPTGHEQSLTGSVATVFVSQRVVFGFDIECLSGRIAADERVGALVKGIHRRQVVRLLLGFKVLVDRLECRTAATKASHINVTLKIQILNLETFIRRVRT